jgi:predicted lipase
MNKDKLLDILDDTMVAYSDSPTSFIYKPLIYYDNKETGIQYFTGSKDRCNLMFSFRGSDDLKNWISNLKFWKKQIPYQNKDTKIRVHSGFYDAYQTIKEDILEFVEQYIKEDCPTSYCIDIMGHSFGAALAVLCAVDLQYHFPKVQFNVILFGCPRVGNRAFAKSYNRRIIKTLRVENGNDLVTKLPFKFLGFKHVGIRIHIGFRRLLFMFSAKNHSCQKYYESLWQK